MSPDMNVAQPLAPSYYNGEEGKKDTSVTLHFKRVTCFLKNDKSLSQKYVLSRDACVVYNMAQVIFLFCHFPTFILGKESFQNEGRNREEGEIYF